MMGSCKSRDSIYSVKELLGLIDALLSRLGSAGRMIDVMLDRVEEVVQCRGNRFSLLRECLFTELLGVLFMSFLRHRCFSRPGCSFGSPSYHHAFDNSSTSMSSDAVR